MSKIINFHDVNDIRWFDSIINLIKHKYHLIDINELECYYHNRNNLDNVCHITIDDGDNSFYDIIYPVLKKYRIPATLFVSPLICLENKNYWFQEIRDFNHKELVRIISKYLSVKFELLIKYPSFLILKNLKINDIWKIVEIYKNNFPIAQMTSQNMNINQLKEVFNDGIIAIGAHTLNHPILANEEWHSSESEIADSIRNLGEVLGYKIKYFAYPNGLPGLDFGEREIGFLRNSGCTIAFSTENRDFSINDNPLSIPRFGFSSNEGELHVRFKLLSGNYWKIIKDAKPGNEKRQRIKLKKITELYKQPIVVTVHKESNLDEQKRKFT